MQIFNLRILYSIIFLFLANIFLHLEFFTNFHEPILKYIVGSLFLFFWLTGILNSTIKFEKVENGFIFYFFLFWTIFIIIHGINTDILFLKQVLSGYYYFYLFPLIVLIKVDTGLFKNILLISNIVVIGSIIFIILFFDFWIHYSPMKFDILTTNYVAIAGFVFLLWNYLKTYSKIITAFALFLIIILCALKGRRAEFVFYILCLVFGILINMNIFSKGFSKYRRVLNTIFMILFCTILLGFYYLNTDKFSYLQKRFDTGYSSREGVTEELVNELNKSNSWVFGKGINGAFKSKHNAIGKTGKRPGIENGYLQMILNGGLIYLVLFSFIALKAIYLGFFKSNNILVKSLAAYLIINFVLMYGFGVPQFQFKYMLVWIAISGCFSKTLRELNDSQILLSIH